MEKLSSGYRINRSGDDSSGLAISEKMRKQIRGLNRASDNAAEGVSLIQTADGALEEVHTMLQRMRELSVQATNDTNAEKDRAALQDEIDQLIVEVDRVSRTTKFNTINLLDGTLGPGSKATTSTSGTTTPLLRADSETLPTDPDINIVTHVYELSAGDEDGTETEVSNDYSATQSSSGSSQIGDYTVLADVLDKEIVPNAVKALLQAFPNAFSNIKDVSIGIGLAIENNPNSSATASVSMSTHGASDPQTGKPGVGAISYTLKVNTAYLLLNTDGSLDESSRLALEGTILHEMFHGLTDELLTYGMAGGSTGYPLWFIEGMAQTAAGGYADHNDWVNGGLRINTSKSESQISNIVRASANKLGASSGAANYGTGYLACMYLGQLASGKTEISPSNIAAGLDRIMTYLASGKSLDKVIEHISGGKYSGVNAFTGNFGDADSATFIKDLTVVVGSGNGSVTSDAFSKVDLLPDTQTSTVLFDLNPDTSKVKNTYDFVRTNNVGAADNDPSWPTIPNDPGGGGGNNPDPGGGGGGGNPDPTGPTQTTGTSVYSLLGGMILQIGPEAGHSMEIHINRVDSQSLGIAGLKVTSSKDATSSMDKLDVAIDRVSEERARLGAYQNRLEHTIANLNNISENTQAAESAIRDTDMAKEMVHFSKQNILCQAGQAMLAQANQTNSGVLALLSQR